MIIATGTSRFDTHWTNHNYSWSEFLQKLQSPVRTEETIEQYAAMDASPKKDDIKDVGGFVGGKLSSDGHRRKSEILNRSMLTFDLDDATPELLTQIQQITEFNWAYYSTHKSTPERPRLRIIIPLLRPIPPNRYEAVIRKVAEHCHWMSAIDPRSFSVAQLMYWPSVSKNGVYYFKQYSKEGNNLNAGKLLVEAYDDWEDRRQWPLAPGEHIRITPHDGRRKDPREGNSLRAIFCRAYSIPQAIETFLSDVYEPTTDPRRYHLISSHSTAGVQLFGGDHDDLFCCSWHANDPINLEQSNQTVDAFDLVRINKFGDLDNPEQTYSKSTTRPSYKAMCRYCLNTLHLDDPRNDKSITDAIAKMIHATQSSQQD